MTALTLTEVVRALSAKKVGRFWKAHCPVHSDEHPSLDIAPGDRGASFVAICRAGCAQEDVFAAILVRCGRTQGPHGGRAWYACKVVNGIRYELERQHLYADADGCHIGTVRVFRDSGTQAKTVSLYGPDDAPKATAALMKTPYNLRDVCEAIATGKIVYVVEGEKDVETLEHHGLVATCNASGAGKWRGEHSAALAGARRVVILPDQDAPGRAHAQQVARSLAQLPQPPEVCVVELPGANRKGYDVTDWFCDGGTVESLAQLVKHAPVWVPTDTATFEELHVEQADPLRHAPTLRELVSNPALLRPPTAVVAPIAYRGRTTLIASREKVGKSTFFGQMAAYVSTGNRFCGEQVLQGRVLYYALDEPLSDAVRRLVLHGADPDAVRVRDKLPEELAELRAEVEAFAPLLIVVDTLGRLWESEEVDENKAKETVPFIHALSAIGRERDAAIVLLHHTGKGGREYRGSTGIGGAVDAPLAFFDSNPKSNGEDAAPVDVDADDGIRYLKGRSRWGVVSLVARMVDGRYVKGDGSMTLEDRVLFAILEQPGCSRNEVVRCARAQKGRVLAVVQAHIDAGRVRIGGPPKGGLFLTSLGRDALAASDPVLVDDREAEPEEIQAVVELAPPVLEAVPTAGPDVVPDAVLPTHAQSADRVFEDRDAEVRGGTATGTATGTASGTTGGVLTAEESGGPTGSHGIEATAAAADDEYSLVDWLARTSTCHARAVVSVRTKEIDAQPPIAHRPAA